MKHPYTLIAATVIVVGAVVAGLELTNTTHLLHKDTSGTKPTNTINYGPPTDADKKDSEGHKDPVPSKNDGSPTSNTAKKQVTVEITTLPFVDKTAGTVSVNGLVSDIVENGGTCTLTATAASDGKVVRASRPAEANVSNTTCGEVSLPLSSMHTGTWQFVLTYSSATSTGKSDPVSGDI